MEALRSAIQQAADAYLAGGGFVIGLTFGLVVQRTNFCAMGAVADIVSFADYRRLRAWLLATCVALLGTQAARASGVVDLGLSMYLAPRLNWAGHLLGGLIFGVGMVFAGGCPSRNLVRSGSGDMRALIVLGVTGLCAHMTISGVLAPARTWFESHTALNLERASTQSLPGLLASVGAGSEVLLRPLVIAALVVPTLVYCFKDAGFRHTPRLIVGGVGVGLCVLAGWCLSGLAHDEFAVAPALPQSLSYVRPSGDALDYLQRYTAERMPDFGVASVFGVLAGGLLGTLASGRARATGFADSADTLRHLAGAALMGIGGVLALGCTIGQGISGVATLAVGSLLSLAAIIAGGVLGMYWLERTLDDY